VGAAGLLALTALGLDAQYVQQPGVRPARSVVAPVASPIEPASVHREALADSARRPLIGAPSWWPKKTTHQNVAALAVAGAVGFGVVWLLPDAVSKWDKSIPLHVYLRRAYTRPPVWDHDEHFWNYIVHPITGSWAYLLERNHGRRPIRGFLLSTAASIGWEYGFEAFIEQPSIQDLLFTSTLGSGLGELSYRATLYLRRNGFNVVERIVVTIINPGYVVLNGYR
jgi:hypothetical protein